MKKLLCLFLCLATVFSAVCLATADSSVSSAERISTVTFTLGIPKAGTMADTPTTATVPAGVPYYVDLNECYWDAKEGDHYFPLPDNTVFEAGKTYYAEIMIRSDVGEFESDVKVNCTNARIVVPYYLSDQIFPVVELTVPENPDPDPVPDPAPDPAPAGDTEKVTLKKLKSVKLKALSAKKLEISWKKLSKKEQKKIQKIEIQYSTDKSFKTYKTKWAKKTKNTYTIQGLKKNTKYYIRIRAYKKVGNTVYVSKWVTKSKKTKKQ